MSAGNAKSNLPHVGTRNGVRSNSAQVTRLTVPRYGEGRVTPDLQKQFVSCEQQAFRPSMYLDAGRTVQLNIKRLPTPQIRKDYRTSILLGGCSTFTEMAEQNGGRSKSASRGDSVGNRLDEQQRNAQEYEIAVRREELLERQRTQRGGASTSHVSNNVTTHGPSITMSNILDTVDGPPALPPPRAPTPGQRTNRTLRMFAERAKPPDMSFDNLYRPPLDFTLFHQSSKQKEDYDVAVEYPVRRPATTSPTRTQPYTPSALNLVADPVDLNTPQALRHEVHDFENRRAEAEAEVSEYCEEVRAIIHATRIPPPPKLILMLFRFGNVRNLSITDKLRNVGYPVIHEQFTSVSERGCITRQTYLNVIKRYAHPTEMNDAIKVLNCFEKSATGDVELNHFLLGMQILLRCASAGDTLKYCFSLMDTNSRVPRYVTRFEVQSLLSSALSVRREKQLENQRLGLPPQVEEEEGDKEFDVMAKAIHELMEESWRYDYMGRIGLKEFLLLLQDRVHVWKAAVWDDNRVVATTGKPKPSVLFDSMGLDQNWQQQPCVAAAHRMSSKKLLFASLQYVPSNTLKDPHKIPGPSTSGSGFRAAATAVAFQTRMKK